MLLERRKFEFEDFLLDTREKILLHDGKPVSITPKAFQLLLVLVENHGHLVEKDELMNSVWADSFVEEANLAFTIRLLRKALNDDAQKPRFIETVPKRGYRFIAGVKCVETKEKIDKFELIDNSALPSNGEISAPSKNPRYVGESESQSTAAVVALADWRKEAGADQLSESGDAVKASSENDSLMAEKLDTIDSSGRNKTILAAAAILLLAVSIALGYYFFSAKNTLVGDKKSIAVLPLKPINSANRDELYEVGIADSLILRLSSVKGFIVRPLSATRQYADLAQDPLAAGREQQADYVLASNYQLADGKIRITAQLFNVSNGQIEETYKSEKDAGDVFAMQDAVAVEIGNKLSARFDAASGNPTAKRGTTSEDAYRLYLQAMYLYEKRKLSDALKAVELLEQAVRLDPNYAPAWAGLAHAHRTVANQGRNSNIQEEYQKSIEAINKALALDENLANAHSALCDNKMYYEYDFAGAERECRRALELDPNSALSHQIYARYLNSRDRPDEAIAEIKTAIDLEPASLYHQRVFGTCLYFARRYAEAEEQFKRVAAMDENYTSTYTFLIPTLEMQGKEQEAFEWFMKLLAIQKADDEIVRGYQKTFEKSGWQGVLRERLANFAKSEPDKSGEAYFQGAAHNARIGNKDEAFEYLEKSFQRRELWMANLQVEPRLDSLRDDARFVELVRRVESK